MCFSTSENASLGSMKKSITSSRSSKIFARSERLASFARTDTQPHMDPPMGLFTMAAGCSRRTPPLESFGCEPLGSCVSTAGYDERFLLDAGECALYSLEYSPSIATAKLFSIVTAYTKRTKEIIVPKDIQRLSQSFVIHHDLAAIGKPVKHVYRETLLRLGLGNPICQLLGLLRDDKRLP